MMRILRGYLGVIEAPFGFLEVVIEVLPANVSKIGQRQDSTRLSSIDSADQHPTLENAFSWLHFISS